MPNYAYVCEKCKKEFVKNVPMSEYKENQPCPICDKENEKSGIRVVSPVFLKNVG
jgi:putative FmdB family regulatory protein